MARQAKRKWNWLEGLRTYWNYTIGIVTGLFSALLFYTLTKINNYTAIFIITVALAAIFIIVAVGLNVIVKSISNSSN
jgi:hypothetical protein